ncbi:MAG TPA: radical SAM family heme chaperone HemW, partial [Candidatus Binatia bacterium]|nr:radical SAM family heme chaperone HemW [Candidatus Binatia bacterium]
RLWSPHLAGRRVSTVFFGGGTPSLMPLEHMAAILDALRSCFDIAPAAEMSLEANPGTVDQGHIRGLREAGFNRISFGVQSFHDAELLDLERVHSGLEAELAYRWARAAGFDNINLDLIFGLIGQTMEQWQENLERALDLGPDHLSLYALTLEEGTPLTRDVDRGRRLAPDYDLQADMYEWSRRRLATAGFKHYEISNWARPGRECRHNLAYWQNQEWLGLGAGAHSHLFGRRFAAAASPSRYIALVEEAASSQVAAGGPAVLDSMRQVTYRDEAPDAAAALRRQMSETVILALRLREGLDLAAFQRRFGIRLEDAFPEALEETLSLRLTEVAGGRLRVRDEAVLLGDEASLRFLPDG